MFILASVKFKPAIMTHPWIEEDLLYTKACQAFGFDRCCSCCRAVFGGRRSIFRVKSLQEGCYSGCVRRISSILSSQQAVASSQESMDVFSRPYLQTFSFNQQRSTDCLFFSTVTRLWVEEDLVYTSMCQAMGFDHSCSCCKGIFGMRRSTIPNGSSP